MEHGYRDVNVPGIGSPRWLSSVGELPPREMRALRGCRPRRENLRFREYEYPVKIWVSRSILGDLGSGVGSLQASSVM
ncbi:hypothetical protein RchiOBHm_Chr2g0125391 [Rosa chinensis]|uniref:Uncharacterized protein n=1 Tax=Rosa chinensis TaxID=74649 RepID=A0A2P6RTJ2_ROSCH|nr:hypothetical protein RchiOBHm_Chr2g0125391 [Rosa chinensis]